MDRLRKIHRYIEAIRTAGRSNDTTNDDEEENEKKTEYIPDIFQFEDVNDNDKICEIGMGRLTYKFTVEISNFSDENIYPPGKHLEINNNNVKNCSIFSDTFPFCVPTIYPNGKNINNKGYVSICYTNPMDLFSFGDNTRSEVTCALFVTDSMFNERFTHNFKLDYDEVINGACAEVCIDKFIARETVLCQPDEFLDDDTLTIFFEVHGENLYDFNNINEDMEYEIMCSFYFVDSSTDLNSESEFGILFLNSPLGKLLPEKSLYFKRILETNMKEIENIRMLIPSVEVSALMNIGRLFMGGTYLLLENDDDIHSMYAVADKYDIPDAIETCRYLLEKQICNKNLDLLLELTQMIKDDQLMSTVEKFQNDEDYRRQQNELNSNWSSKSLSKIFHIEPQAIQCNEQMPHFEFYL